MGSRSTQILVVVAVVIGAAFAIAVGFAVLGDDARASRADYQETVVNARDRVDFALVRITRSTSTDELVERIDEAAAVIGQTASDVADEGVAEGFDAEHERLVNTLRAFSNELAGTAAQFRDPTFGGAVQSITSLSFPQWDRLNAVFAELREQGLEVPALPRH